MLGVVERLVVPLGHDVSSGDRIGWGGIIEREGWILVYQRCLVDEQTNAPALQANEVVEGVRSYALREENGQGGPDPHEDAHETQEA